MAQQQQKNVLGTALQVCGLDPTTGYFRDGLCHTGPTDQGRHCVCAVVTDEFLDFSAGRGNDLKRAAPQYGFPGLKDGDRWCLCVVRWKEAYEHGVAPPVVLEATNAKSLEIVPLDWLKEKAHQSLE